ncbi:hypothetical protein D3C85_665390 [compost metagenome]
MVELVGQLTRRPQVDVELLDHMDGQADGPGLIHDGPFDGLTDPPGRIGGEAEAPLRIELLHRPDQAEVTLFDQVEQREPAIDVASRDLHHESEVAFDHALAPGRISALSEAREVHFFFRG